LFQSQPGLLDGQRNPPVGKLAKLFVVGQLAFDFGQRYIGVRTKDSRKDFS
jgi:hypothetical protein